MSSRRSVIHLTIRKHETPPHHGFIDHSGMDVALCSSLLQSETLLFCTITVKYKSLCPCLTRFVHLKLLCMWLRPRLPYFWEMGTRWHVFSSLFEAPFGDDNTALNVWTEGPSVLKLGLLWHLFHLYQAVCCFCSQVGVFERVIFCLVKAE